MKRIVLTACVLSAMILTAGAQQRNTVSMTRNTGTTVGVHAGVNMFNINGRNPSGTELNNDLNTGFAAGVNVELPLSSGFYLQPGIDFRQKGSESDATGAKTTLNYIDIPVNFIYKPMVGRGNMVLGFGPYVGFGIGGKVNYTNNTTTEVKFTENFDGTYPTAAQFKRTDAGANLIAGYEFPNNLSLNLNAQLGLKNINPEMPASVNDQTRFRNTGFGLSLGYRF